MKAREIRYRMYRKLSTACGKKSEAKHGNTEEMRKCEIVVEIFN
jgi:hypothetical protein